MAIGLGSSGPLTRSWQQFLVAEQLLPAADCVAAAGLFDAATAAASQAFQRRVGLHPDGIVGTRTLELARQAGYSGVAPAERYTLLYGLRSAAFDDWDHPAALCYAPPGFDPDELAIVVYLHGIDNNIENVVQKDLMLPNYPVADLLGHLDRSLRNALLVVPELRYNASRSDPGRLGEPGALRALLGEIFDKPLPSLSGLRTDRIGRIVLISHSGGYRAAAAMALGGGLRVDELYLLDSLYGEEEAFTAYLMETLSELGTAAGRGAPRRLVNLYTHGGRTAELSRALGQKARAEAERRQLAAELVVTTEEPLAPEALPGGFNGAPRVLIQRVAVDHSDIPICFVGQLLAHSDLPRCRS